MRVRIYSNGKEAFVSPFVGRFTANVCRAVAGSLKTQPFSRRIDIVLAGEDVRLSVDGRPVDLDGGQGFARIITRDTLGGMVQNLKGIEPGGSVRIEVELEDELEK